MAVQGQGLARGVGEPAEFGPAGSRDLRGEDPPVQELPADFIQAIAVPTRPRAASGDSPGPGESGSQGGAGDRATIQSSASGFFGHQSGVFGDL